jgi:hypothetical protein
MIGDRVKAGQPISARSLSVWSRLADRISRIRAGSGLSSSWDAVPNMRDRTPGRFFARLTGTSSPYDMTEQLDAADGTFADLVDGRSCTACAYEANGATGLNGKIAELMPGPVAGEYRFKFVRWGTSPPCVFTAKATVCSDTLPNGDPIAGATVVLKQGATTIGTCTTGADGTCTIPYAGSGTYTASATLGGFTISRTFTASGCSNSFQLFRFAPACNSCINGADFAPWPSTVTIGTPGGSVTLTRRDEVGACVPNGQQLVWTGCSSFTAAGWDDPYCPPCSHPGHQGSVSTPMYWHLSCSCTDVCYLTLRAIWPIALDGTPQPETLCYASGSHSIIVIPIECDAASTIGLIADRSGCDPEACGCWTDPLTCAAACGGTAAYEGLSRLSQCYPINFSFPMHGPASGPWGSSWTATLTP